MGGVRENLFIVGTWYALGVAATMYIEHWDLVTSSYVIMQVITTVGYGDLTVSDPMHWFMTFFVLFGIVIVANIVTDLINEFMLRRMDGVRAELRAVETSMVGRGEVASGTYKGINQLIAATTILAAFILMGAIFFSTKEGCSCGFGNEAIVGCTADNCAEKGMSKNFAASVYMAVVTLTTVGFGDFTPVSWVGRLVAIPWMLMGVLACANFVSAFSDWRHSWDQKRTGDTHEFSQQVFKAIDKDNNNTLCKAEFALWMLMRKGMVTLDSLEDFDRTFAAVDKSGSGKIDHDTLRAAFLLRDAGDGLSGDKSNQPKA